MSSFNLANPKGRDASVDAQSIRTTVRVRWLDEEGRQATGVRMVKATVEQDIRGLEADAGGLENVAQRLIDGDPEVDIETFGRLLRETSRVFVDPHGQIVHKVVQVEVVRNPDGTERERRPRNATKQNTNTDEPIRLSGRTMKKAEGYNRFVFALKRQLLHLNGLTYDFLYSIDRDHE